MAYVTSIALYCSSLDDLDLNVTIAPLLDKYDLELVQESGGGKGCEMTCYVGGVNYGDPGEIALDVSMVSWRFRKAVMLLTQREDQCRPAVWVFDKGPVLVVDPGGDL